MRIILVLKKQFCFGIFTLNLNWLVFSLICDTPDRSYSCRDVSPSSYNVKGNRGQIPCVSVTEQHRLSLTDQTGLLEDELQPVFYFVLCSTSQNCISCRTQLYLSVGIRRAKCLNCVKMVFVLDLETMEQVLPKGHYLTGNISNG